MKKITLLTILFFANLAYSYNIGLNESVKNSNTIKQVIIDLNVIGLDCSIGLDEDGEEKIQYLVRDIDDVRRSTFRAMYPCSNGQSAIFDGVVGDNGTVAVYNFQLLYAE